VIDIYYSAFESCSLSSISIPAGLVDIGFIDSDRLPNLSSFNVDADNQFFQSRSGVLFSKDGAILYKVPNRITDSYIIPDGVRAIRGYAFWQGSLTSITILAATPPFLPWEAFEGNEPGIVIHVPSGCAASYQAADGWANNPSYSNYVRTVVSP
jgi:hypothetical protein